MTSVMQPVLNRQERADLGWISDLDDLHALFDEIIAGVKESQIHGGYSVRLMADQIHEPANKFMGGDMLLFVELLAADLQTAGIACHVRLTQNRDLTDPRSFWGLTCIAILTTPSQIALNDMWIADKINPTRCVLEYITGEVE